MMKIFAPILIVGLMTSSGCITCRQNSEDIQGLRAEIYQMNNRIKELEDANQKLFGDMSGLKNSTSTASSLVSSEMSKVRSELNKVSADRERIKAEIIADLSKKMADTIKQHATPPPETGRYHVVARGDTLSAIATAYGVKMKSIVKANGLKNVNDIKVDQKLFIPDR